MQKNNIAIHSLGVDSQTSESLITTHLKRENKAEEVEYLQHLLQRALSPRKRTLKAILNTLVMLGGTLVALLLVSGVASYLTPYSEYLRLLLNFAYLQELAITASSCFALYSSYRWLKSEENNYPLILQDITEAQVFDETYVVLDVCRFQEPKMGGFIYFLKISAQDIFVVYDYQSQTESNQVLLILNQLTLSRAPHSGFYVSQRFQGQAVALSATYPITLPPEKWPKPDSWLSLSWSDLESSFNQK